MNEAIIQLLAQWGMAGLFIAAAGYIIWDNWKKNKKMEEWFRDKISATDSRQNINNGLDDINVKLDNISADHAEFRSNVLERIETLEKQMSHHHPSNSNAEQLRMTAITTIAPSIHTIISEGLDNCEVDHIAVALLHNGTTALSGIPYIKFGIIAEKYRPIRYPNDIDLFSKYKDEDIMGHNRLPICIVQNPNVVFKVEPESPLVEIDPIIYQHCVKRQITYIAFEAIRDIHGLTTGFVVAYKFTDAPIDMDALHHTSTAIEDLYRNMLANLA